jgi:hypothetical protein
MRARLAPAAGSVIGVTGTDVPRPEAAADRPSLLEWQERLRASPGFRAIALQNRVRRIGYLFQANVAQYKSLVASLQDPGASLPFFDVRTPEAHDDLLMEAERLLHNVLTAMSTCVDQQRRFMDHNFRDDPALVKEHRDRIASAFGASTEAAFLKGLRNYMTHLQLPVAQSRQTFGSASFEVTFILPVRPLLGWDGWNAGIRAWISGQGEAIAVVDVVDAYARMAGDCDKWLHDQIGQRHQAEIAAFLSEQDEYTREYDRVFGT